MRKTILIPLLTVLFTINIQAQLKAGIDNVVNENEIFFNKNSPYSENIKELMKGLGKPIEEKFHPLEIGMESTETDYIYDGLTVNYLNEYDYINIITLTNPNSCITLKGFGDFRVGDDLNKLNVLTVSCKSYIEGYKIGKEDEMDYKEKTLSVYISSKEKELESVYKHISFWISDNKITMIMISPIE